MLKTLIVTVMLSLCSVATAAPSAPSTTTATAATTTTTTAASLDAAVRQQLGAGFNGVVLVRDALHAAPVVRAYGLADIDSSRVLTPDTAFQIGSISKWISAVAVLRLVDQGKLALDVPISNYLPELPATRAGVTLRHLLSNSAGIPNGVMEALKKD